MLSSDSDLFVAIGSDGLSVTTLPRAFPDLDPGISPSSCRSGSFASHTGGDRKGRPTEHAGRANPWEHYRGGCRASHTFETGVFEMEVVEFHHTAWQHTQAATARIGLSCGVREELGRAILSLSRILFPTVDLVACGSSGTASACSMQLNLTR